MTDKFSDFATGLESPATNILGITPNDTVDLLNVSRALNVAGTGAVRVTSLGGDIETVHIAAGIAFPLRVTRVWATGTTATGIVALY